MKKEQSVSTTKREDASTNPYGANQYTLDPRQKLCWDSYVDPRSETFGNGYASAIKAGYEEYTAKVITTLPWFAEKLRRLQMLGKAEKVLDETLDLPAIDEENKVDSSVLKIKTDVAKFVASTQGKDVGYSTRKELTGADGKDLSTNLTEEQQDKLNTLLNSI